MIHHYQIRLTLIHDEEESDYYEVEALDFFTCVTTGRTVDEALENVLDAMQGCLLTCKDCGLPIPAGYKLGDKLNEDCTLLVTMDEDGHVLRYFEDDDDVNYLQFITADKFRVLSYRFGYGRSEEYCNGFVAGIEYMQEMINKAPTFVLPLCKDREEENEAD